MLFRGVAPALVTPFSESGEIDKAAFCGLIEHQITSGASAVVVLGTTGENPTVTSTERSELVATAAEYVSGRVPVVVGTGTNSTAESVSYSIEAERLGADGLLVVGPYYNKPPQGGFEAHVAAIAAATSCPIILYNVPSRTGFDIDLDTILNLANEIPAVVGVKEASGDLSKVADLVQGRPDGFAVYSGDDEWTLFFLVLGADGVISVVSNVLPRMMHKLTQAGLQGDLTGAAGVHYSLVNAMRACFFDTNPIPVKAVLAHLGKCRPTVRLPLVELSSEKKSRVMAAFASALEDEIGIQDSSW